VKVAPHEPERRAPARRFNAGCSGFTLIELVISAGLMAMILGSAYVCLQAGFSSQNLIEPRIDVFQNARVAMGLITADLRSACVLSRDSEFVGMHRMLGEAEADNLDFATHNYTPRHTREGDYCQVSYFLGPRAGRFSLWRRRNPTIGLDPFSGGNREEIARGLLGLRFEYYDGWEWFDTWGDAEGRKQFSRRERSNLYGLPEAVRITMSFDPNPHPTVTANKETNQPPLVFRTVARLNLSAASQRSSSPVAGGSTEAGGQAAPGPQTGGPN
jgi:prepilin-type N-terminal cleavage/methylation domain-containing protein